MTRLEVALLFVAVWEAGVIAVFGQWIRHLERREPCGRVHWEPLQYWRGDSWGPDEVWLGGRGGGKVSTGAELRRRAADALGVRLHDDGTVFEVPASLHLVEGTEVTVVRGPLGDPIRRRYRVVRSDRFAGDELRLEALDG